MPKNQDGHFSVISRVDQLRLIAKQRRLRNRNVHVTAFHLQLQNYSY